MSTSSALPSLLVPRAQLDGELLERIDLGKVLKDRQVETPDALDDLQGDYDTWDEFNVALLKRSFTTSEIADEYIGGRVFVAASVPAVEAYRELVEYVNRDIRKLASVRSRLSLFTEQLGESDSSIKYGSAPESAKDVFIVHGHNEAVKQSVARFVRQVTDREPIVLHEQANSGKTIIEKFEDYSRKAGFAIVLLTADDEAGQRGSGEANLRARQNVILELGFFLGRIGRDRVAALYESGVEIPSDFSGVLYTSIEAGWQLELGREMRAAGIDVNLNRAT